MSSNFGPLTRDHFSKNIHIKGATVIDSHQNITGNVVRCSKLIVNSNAMIGNIVSNKLIVGNIITGRSIIGDIYGNIFDELGQQILTIRQPAIDNPNVIVSFVPNTNVDITVVPSIAMPSLGPSVIPMSSDIQQNSVEHLLYYNLIKVQEELMSLRSQMVKILDTLRTHGIIFN